MPTWYRRPYPIGIFTWLTFTIKLSSIKNFSLPCNTISRPLNILKKANIDRTVKNWRQNLIWRCLYWQSLFQHDQLDGFPNFVELLIAALVYSFLHIIHIGIYKSNHHLFTVCVQLVISAIGLSFFLLFFVLQSSVFLIKRCFITQNS